MSSCFERAKTQNSERSIWLPWPIENAIEKPLVGGDDDWNMDDIFVHSVGNVIIPIDFHVFQRGRFKPPDQIIVATWSSDGRGSSNAGSVIPSRASSVVRASENWTRPAGARHRGWIPESEVDHCAGFSHGLLYGY